MRTTFTKLVALTVSFIFTLQYANSQSYFGPQVQCQHESCGLEADPEDKFTFIPPPAGFEFGASRDAVISVSYNGFSTQAQNAFQYAVDIWASYLESSVPITINANWSSLSGSVLGFAGSNDYERNFTGATMVNTWYPAALANKLRGADLNPGTADISCTFNSNTNWYYGTDGNTPSGQYDLVSVVLHELGHGLGSIGGSSYNSGTGTYGFGGTPVIWDVFIENGSMQNLSTFSSPSTTLGSQLTGNSLYWDGSNGVSGLNGNRPRIYAPSSWNGGSSYSHLNEGSYSSGNPNSLMTPFIGAAEAIHDPGPAMLGMFQDMGWEIFPECDIFGFQLVGSTPCDVATGNFDLTVDLLYENPPTTGFINVNGTNYSITSSPQEFTFTLPADGSNISFDVFFTADGSCTYSSGNIFTAPPACCANLRYTALDPENKQFEVTNFGTCSEDMSAYRICSDLDYGLFNNVNVVSGSMTIAPGQTTLFQWNAWNPDPLGTDLAIFVPFADFSNPSDMRDYVQWRSEGNGGEAVAVAAGYWTAGDFLADGAPYAFTGTALEYGPQFWDGQEIIIPCAISSISEGNGSGCNITNQEYTQEVIISYSDEPSTGDLNVNGQLFNIESSPQTVLLTGLNSDGGIVDVTVFFTDDMSCTASETALFTAPEACLCKYDYDSNGIITIDDLIPLLTDFGCTQSCSADLDGDDAVTASDISIFLQVFGTPCP